MDFKIRLAKTDDIIEIRKLAFQIFPHAQLSFSAPDEYFLAESKSGLIGFCHLRILGNSIILQGLGVLPAHRGAGVGKALASHALKWAKEKFPGRPFKLKVLKENMPAISVYLKEGFMPSKDDGAAYLLANSLPN